MVFKNKFQNVWSNRAHIFILFLKNDENNVKTFTCSLKIIFYFTLFLKIIFGNSDQTVLEIFKNNFLFLFLDRCS